VTTTNPNSVHGVPAHHDGGSATEALVRYLPDEAGGRTISQAVAGQRFCAVRLDDGGVGVANLCPDVCGQPSGLVLSWLPRPGTPAADALATLAPPTLSAIGLATANALANRPRDGGGEWDRATTGGDLLDALPLTSDDHVGMVGCFSPLVEPIRHRVQRLSIFERAQRLTPDLLPENRAAELLPQCSVALITATTLMNGTVDALLIAAANCREVVLLGPSTPLVPQVSATWPRWTSFLSSVIITDAERLLHTVARGGGTRDFRASVEKVNIRVKLVGTNAP
jgi:uncharacterized protein (DUF4213/DUF364 family)